MYEVMRRLHPRGAASTGITVDPDGAMLGPDCVLVRRTIEGYRCIGRGEAAALQAFLFADGMEADWLFGQCRRISKALDGGEIVLAQIFGLRIPINDLADASLKQLATAAPFIKANFNPDEPRIPAGQPGGGEWTTTGGSGGTTAIGVKPAAGSPAPAPAHGAEPPLLLDDAVYRPGSDDPLVVLTGGAEEEEPSRGSNGPPDDYTRLEDVFPGLRDAPGLAIPLAPIDGFLGVSALADEANLEATLAQYSRLVADIKRVDPSFADQELLPAGGIAGLSWQGRANLINGLRMQRAAAYYRVLGDVGPLQVETLRFLQGAVDAAYADAVSAADAGRLQPRLSREEAIGNEVDRKVRLDLRNMFRSLDIPFGAGEAVTINNRDYETADNGSRYRVPDARLADVAFDWTLSLKTIGSAQIRGFFRADSEPRAVVIIRPSALGQVRTYVLPRPDDGSL
jgi:hypothetical protein